MKSKASVNGHPLHPILVAFPIAFFTATLLFDILAYTLPNSTLWPTARYMNMLGVLFTVVAAVPGLIDYMYSIPPDSSAKKRGTQHGLLNTTVLVLFIIALWLRSHYFVPVTLIVLEGAAFVLLTISGYMGGTLVYRNQIAVYNRYANSGEWREATTNKQRGEIEVAGADELKADQMKLVHVGNKRIVIARTNDGFVAFDDRCSHKGGSLAGGTLICGTVQCPWHGSQFDCTTGSVKAGPATSAIGTYKISEKDGKLILHI